MAGPIASEAGTAAPQELVGPRVEYKPFSEFTPQQMAELTGGDLNPGDTEEHYIGFDDWYLHYGGGGVNWVEPRYRNKVKGASVVIPGLGSHGHNEAFSVAHTVVLTSKDQPRKVTFVKPGEPQDEASKRSTYDWITISDRGVSLDRAPATSPKVTPEIRHAAEMAWYLRSAREEAVA